MTYAPIAVFAYNRPQHLSRTLNALKNNKEAAQSVLYLFLDGAKENTVAQVAEVESVARSITGFAKINIVKREQNIGLAQNIISGINQILLDYETVIILEDDLMPSAYFLQFMNDGLRMYADNVKVASVHGYVHPLKQKLPQTFFLKYPNSWGWATWRRAWRIFESDGSKLMSQLADCELVKQFDFNGNYRFTRMLQRQIDKKNNSWAIRWYASVFLNDMLCFYPGDSFIKDFGNDGSGENCFNDSVFDVNLRQQPLELNVIDIEDNKAVRNMYESYFYRIDSLFFRALIKAKRYFRSKK
jgi:hypothetical protein